MNNHTQSSQQLGTTSLRQVGGSRCWLMASLAAFTVFVAGCGANESENIGSTQAAFTVDSCAEANANQTFAGKIDPPVVSPRSYTTCYKGYVVDIQNLNAAYTGLGNASDAKIAVEYADTRITDQATCEGTELTAVFYETWYSFTTSVTNGVTTNGRDSGWGEITTETRFGGWFQGRCYLGVDWRSPQPETDYRVAATARTPGNATRKVKIGTYMPVNVH